MPSTSTAIFPRVVENVSRESSFQFVNDEITLPDREYPGFWAEREPDRLAIVVHGSDQSMTFLELHNEAARISNLFRSLGLKPEDHVAFCLSLIHI